MWEQRTTLDDKTYQQEGATDFGLADEVFGLKYGILSSKLNAMLHALTKDTKVNILSTPRIMTKKQSGSDYQRRSGGALPCQHAGRQRQGAFLTSTDFRDVGVILTVTPRINRSGTVSLDVNQQINSLVEFTLFRCPDHIYT